MLIFVIYTELRYYVVGAHNVLNLRKCKYYDKEVQTNAAVALDENYFSQIQLRTI